MRWSLLALAAISTSPLVMFSLIGIGGANPSNGPRVSDPIVHENLAVYFIHAKSEAGNVPLTLEEAMAKGVVRVKETSNVNQLEIENLGHEEVFVQSGDIVKGGKQDRTLMVSLVLPPKSGSISDRLVLRRGGALVAARARGCGTFFDRVGGGTVARNEAGDEGADAGAGRRCGRQPACKRLCGRNRAAPAAGVGGCAAHPGQARRPHRCTGTFGAVGVEPAACA